MMKSVFIIISPDGGIGLSINDGKGKVYNDKDQAEIELEAKNKWSKSKGYGVYELVELVIEHQKITKSDFKKIQEASDTVLEIEEKHVNNDFVFKLSHAIFRKLLKLQDALKELEG